LDGGDDDGPVDGGMVVPVPIEEHAAMQASLQPVKLPPLGAAGSGKDVVHFDTCSPASGVLLGYVKCPQGHSACFRYRQMNVAGNRERLVAHVYAWVLMGQDLETKEEHREVSPTEADVDHHVQLLFPADNS
jgi:hypothetical protein